MTARRIDWPAWDVLSAPAMIYVAELPVDISQDNIDVLFNLLPDEYSGVSIDCDNGILSLLAASNLLKFLPIIAPYDYEISFKRSLARLTLRHRNRLTFIFDHDGMCSLNADDRVGNAFLYSGSSGKFLLDDAEDWRAMLEQSTLNSLGKGFL